MLALNNGYSGWQIRLWFLDSAAQVEANHKKWVKNNGRIQNDTHFLHKIRRYQMLNRDYIACPKESNVIVDCVSVLI